MATARRSPWMARRCATSSRRSSRTRISGATYSRQMTHRDFLQIPDFTKDEIVALFELADSMRAGKYDKKPLAGKSLAMIFMKASTRTRVSFEVGTYQLGGHALFLSPRDVPLGRGEPDADTAPVLSRSVHGVIIRTLPHQ